MFARLLPALLLAACLAVPAFAAGPQDKADIQEAEAYLNAVTSLKARFLQVSGTGGQAEGTAYLSRPGKMRLQYDPPSPLLVVADGSFLIVNDKTLDNPSYIPLGSTPAGVLVRPNVQLDGKDLRVIRVSHQPGVVAITVVSADDPAQGSLTLIFSERPFALRQWRVLDAQGQLTTVSLYDVQTGLPLDPKLFEFQNPNFAPPKL